MNTISDYDVDDEALPQNTHMNTNTNTSTITSINRNRINKNVKDTQPVEKNKKERAPRPKLDFNRLLKGSRGLGYLAVCTRKSLKLSGKPGSEAQDLSQIIVYLQEWAKLVFPKMSLIEFLVKVEEICQSRIMKACVPEILERIKQMGEDVNLNDLARVESEVFTKMATDQAEQALEEIGNDEENSNIQVSSAVASKRSTNFDFDLEKILETKFTKKRNPERYEFDERNSELDSELDESISAGLDSKELDDFINDNSDSENAIEKDSKSLRRSGSCAATSIPFEILKGNESESESEIDSENELNHFTNSKKLKKEISNFNLIIDEDTSAGAPIQSRRTIGVIQQSSSDTE